MSYRRTFLSCSFVALSMLISVAGTQTWSPSQQEVWQTVELSWKLGVAKDLSWIEKMTHPSVTCWDDESPAPANRASLLRWGRFMDADRTILEYELYPVSITIKGDVAVTHYRFALVRENTKKERKSVIGRYTDVWVKEGGNWLLFTSFGANDPTK